MKVNTFPKILSIARFASTLSLNKEKSKKQTFPVKCFMNFAIKFRQTYVKKFSCNKKGFYRNATSFLSDVSVSPDKLVDIGDGDVKILDFRVILLFTVKFQVSPH